MTTPPAHPRLAVVTGADSGMGKAIAELLATEGYDVGITFHTDAAGAEDTRRGVEERGQRCFVAQQDAAHRHSSTRRKPACGPDWSATQDEAMPPWSS